MTTTSGTGYIEFRGYRTWYRIVGGGDATPLLLVHGGPAIPTDYLEPLEVLADERPVIFYDQLGCGRSDRPSDTSLWQMATFVDELTAVREQLGLDHVHLFGHSWGGRLLLEYASRRPDGIESWILASAVPSVQQAVEEWFRLAEAIDPAAREVLVRHEVAGTTDDPEYRAIFDVWLQRHMMRAPLDAWPEPLNRSFAGMGSEVYGTIWNGGQFTPQGEVDDPDLAPMRELNAPVLLLHGRHDYLTPAIGESLRDAIPGAELHVFEHTSHLPWFEDPETFFATMRSWLKGGDRTSDAS